MAEQVRLLQPLLAGGLILSGLGTPDRTSGRLLVPARAARSGIAELRAEARSSVPARVGKPGRIPAAPRISCPPGGGPGRDCSAPRHTAASAAPPFQRRLLPLELSRPGATQAPDYCVPRRMWGR